MSRGCRLSGRIGGLVLWMMPFPLFAFYWRLARLRVYDKERREDAGGRKCVRLSPNNERARKDKGIEGNMNTGLRRRERRRGWGDWEHNPSPISPCKSKRVTK